MNNNIGNLGGEIQVDSRMHHGDHQIRSSPPNMRFFDISCGENFAAGSAIEGKADLPLAEKGRNHLMQWPSQSDV